MLLNWPQQFVKVYAKKFANFWARETLSHKLVSTLGMWRKSNKSLVCSVHHSMHDITNLQFSCVRRNCIDWSHTVSSFANFQMQPGVFHWYFGDFRCSAIVFGVIRSSTVVPCSVVLGFIVCPHTCIWFQINLHAFYYKQRFFLTSAAVLLNFLMNWASDVS